jgi:hypothetical protein
LYTVLWITGTSWYPLGKNIYEEDWDALIILDACRVDALREVAPEYDYIKEVDSVMSIAGTSKEWVDHTFTEKYQSEVAETAYITANSFAEQLAEEDRDYLRYLESEKSIAYKSDLFHKYLSRDKLNSDDFHTFTPLFKQIVGDPVDQLHPEVVTDVAIRTARKSDANRLLVHYMQPHKPYLYAYSQSESYKDRHRRPFKYLRQTGNKHRVWQDYLDNLRFVLDHVETLLSNTDAKKVVITADHGEMFGELGMTGHKAGIIHPVLRWVPWCVTRAEDSGEYEPSEHLTDDQATEKEVQNRLDALGYT